MPISRLTTTIVPIALSALLLHLPARAAAPVPLSPTAQKAPAAVDVEVKYIDDSTMKLQVLDERLELVTKYGSLQVAVADIRKIEFASRTPPEMAGKIAAAIANMGNPDFGIRERASAEVRGYRERAYQPLLKALKNPDPEIGRRAEDALRHIKHTTPPGYLEAREFDVIHTDDSRITGKLLATRLRVNTFQFGELQLRLADIRSLRSATGIVAEEVASSGPTPANLSAYQNQFGKLLVFNLTGAQAGTQAGVWGSDAYTLDSNLAAAAVHAGVLQPGQTGIARVRIINPPPQFVGSIRNGITSSGFGNFPAGAYEFVQK